MQFATVAPTLQNIRDGKLRALATTGRKRVFVLYDLPTMIESGVKDYDVALWFGYVAPAGTPDAITGRLNRELAAILRDPETAATLRQQGFEPEPGPPEAVAPRIAGEIELWRGLIAKTGIKPE
jgi:tripartite-type tricarboxylate transporter receptor subunit TctC